MRNQLIALVAGTLLTSVLSLPRPEPVNDPAIYSDGILSSYLPSTNPDPNQPNPAKLTAALSSTSQVDIRSLTSAKNPSQLPISAPPVVTYPLSLGTPSFSTVAKLALWYYHPSIADSNHYHAFLNAVTLQVTKLKALPGTTVINGTRTTLGRGPAPKPGPAPDGPVNSTKNEQATVATLILDGNSRSPEGCTVTLAIQGLEAIQNLVQNSHLGVAEGSAWTALRPSRGSEAGGADGAEAQGQAVVKAASCTWWGNADVPLSELQKPVQKWPEEGGGVETGGLT
ncbi:uncharacterized protein KY384_002362 [Bacidia gigantensis]|uniref:uncharacterized protein n=1 Tax=Bacidia gigantensis TaxID=2732470 RepID=UPI001D051367|nr:uncharacterized protein KY384_002362 [Bacidia gigantensis]KAG8532485.1 hypothetical protein KY384_002362 [Bacidia gigantensis]